MKHLLTLALLCTALFTRAAIRPDTWNDIDTLLAQGHYTTAYDACSQLIKRARRTHDSHALLVATYKQRTAAEAYQENAVEGSIEAYRQVLPHLKGADKAIAHLLIAHLTGNSRSHYEAALAESQALKAIPANAYDLLIAGDSDRVVPYEENGAILEKAYRDAGADITVILKKGCDHHPHSIEDPTPAVEFIERANSL
jgi:pimeloyl-ACP methyl ester carboxylesterase